MSGWLRKLGLRLQPLFDPDREKTARRLATLRREGEAERKALAARLTETVAQHRREMKGVREDALRMQRESQARVQATLRAIRTRLSRDGALTSGVLRRTRRVSDQQIREEVILRRIARIGRSTRPILVGPWMGEVGFELLYWAPFVRWFAATYNIAPERLTIVSRGGSRSWYGDVAAAYVDVLDSVPAAQFTAERVEHGLKQMRLSALDRQIVRRTAAARGLVHPAVLHPEHMFGLFEGFFTREAGVRHVFKYTHHAPVVLPARTLVPGLPDDYVAAKFYFRPSFPETPENVAFVRGVLDEIARDHKVVLMNPGLALDDHRDFRDKRYIDMASLGTAITPQNNLEVQTAVVSGARAFVGTYGGFSYLAPLCGVPALTFYSDRGGFYLHHRYLADVVFATIGAPALVMLPTDTEQLQRRVVLDLLAAPSRRAYEP